MEATGSWGAWARRGMLLVGMALIAWLAFGPPGARGEYRTGQFCSLEKQAEYNKAGFTCKKASDGRNRLHKLKSKSKPKPERARVVHIVDGDTVRVKRKGKEIAVRIIGIDTPEIGRCGYNEATDSLERMIPAKAKIRLVRDTTQPNRDRYKRLLRYVHRGKTDVGRRQIALGWAKVFVVGKGFSRKAQYKRSQDAAKDKDIGRWGNC